jgi:dipeptidase
MKKTTKKLTLTENSSDGSIIISKANDNSPKDRKRIVRAYIIDEQQFTEFKSIVIEKPHNSILHKVKSIMFG